MLELPHPSAKVDRPLLVLTLHQKRHYLRKGIGQAPGSSGVGATTNHSMLIAHGVSLGIGGTNPLVEIAKGMLTSGYD